LFAARQSPWPRTTCAPAPSPAARSAAAPTSASPRTNRKRSRKPGPSKATSASIPPTCSAGTTTSTPATFSSPSWSSPATSPTNDDTFSLDVYASVWSNIAEDTPKTSGPRHWNEFDATLGVGFNFGDWSIALEYLYYNSPANDFDDIHEVGVILAYDHWLAPSIGYYQEIDDRNGPQDTYLEFKLEPTLPSIPWLEELEVTVPMVLGTSLDGYYLGPDGDNSFFGYAAIGLSASYPLNDNWSVVGGVEYHHLFADNIEDLNSDSHYKVVGRIGVAFEY
jgi:hypothetical protein